MFILVAIRQPGLQVIFIYWNSTKTLPLQKKEKRKEKDNCVGFSSVCNDHTVSKLKTNTGVEENETISDINEILELKKVNK